MIESQGSRLKAQGSRLKAQGSRLKAQGSRLKAQVERGFTLIELMIVVTVLGILASIAMPMYGDYTARAQVAEAFSLGSGLKVALADFYTTYGQLPEGNEEAGLNKAEDYETKYIERIDVVANRNYGANGVATKGSGFVAINITFQGDKQIGQPLKVNKKDIVSVNSRIAGKTMSIVGEPIGAVLHWTCSGDLKSGWGSVNNSPGSNTTGNSLSPLEEKYLPAVCKKKIVSATP